ncbi:hypothetical protein F4779DRAFT_371390 [Xylariaceae sp. FL0662B]|nr:hypothetical protein F4779DRAFT_371390 [Xylariaceae sp. FL0662B]
MSSFQLFSQLPLELRLIIWRFSLQQNRLVTIILASKGYYPYQDNKDNTSPPYTATNILGNIVSGNKYCTMVYKVPRFHSLLKVNSEARCEALRFYRVRLPCLQRRLHPGPRITVTCELYFNPEYDYIHLDASNTYYAFELNAIPDFLSDVKAYDPRGTGILHLVMPRMGAIEPSDVAPQALEGFKEAIKTLQSLWVFSHGSVKMIGGMADRSWARKRLSSITNVPSVLRLRTFNRLKVDQSELFGYHISGFISARLFMMVWQQLERDFGIHRDRPIDFRYFLRKGHMVYENENDIPFRIDYGDYPIYVDAQPGRVPRLIPMTWLQNGTAIGFWLFPIEVFGRIPETRTVLHREVTEHVFDTVDLKPDICVFELEDD